MCTWVDVLNFKYRDLKMFLLELGSELQNLIKKFESVLKKNKMQTSFPRSGIFPQSGTHRVIGVSDHIG